ncbi:MAG TPA: arylamine N-acetyltransferase [Anaerolineales bacterium]
MTTIPYSLAMEILDYLDIPPKAPTLRYLNRLIHTYIRKVPWESVSRIIKRHTTPLTKDCPRLPVEFWNDAMQYGLGGTCYESSLAFFSLLTVLGFEGYLTVNDMGETRGCHAAITVLINGHKYLVDVTIPVHAAVRIDPRRTIKRTTGFHDYTVRPIQDDTYEVERSHHPHRSAFTLIDIPVSLPEYQTIMNNDYLETGYFLKSVVMVKVINGKTWRFFSDHVPYRLESFNRGGKREIFVGSEILPRVLTGLFHMPEDKIYTAFSHIAIPLSQRDTEAA